MVQALGIIAFEKDNVRIQGVSNYRPLMSASFLGRYRLMDFPISNLTNSGIERIHLHVKEKPRSVFEHVGTGRHYNINSKKGKLRVLYGENEMTSAIYNTDIQSYLQNEQYIWEEDCEYVIVAPSHFVYLQDFRKVLNKHIESNADITILTKKIDDAKEYFLGCQTVAVGKDKRITKFDVNRGQAKNREISLECYVLKRQLFMQLCHEANNMSSVWWFSDILSERVGSLVMNAYSVNSTVFGIVDLKSYYSANMTMLNKQVNDLFDEDWPIYTRTNDSVPVLYGPNAKVKNSMVANGSVIHGEVENCVIGRNVYIESGTKIKNCLILPSSYIGKDVDLDGLVIDKHVSIVKEKVMKANPGEVIYIKRHDKL